MLLLYGTNKTMCHCCCYIATGSVQCVDTWTSYHASSESQRVAIKHILYRCMSLAHPRVPWCIGALLRDCMTLSYRYVYVWWEYGALAVFSTFIRWSISRVFYPRFERLVTLLCMYYKWASVYLNGTYIPCAATTIHETWAYLHVFSSLKEAISMPPAFWCTSERVEPVKWRAVM